MSIKFHFFKAFLSLAPEKLVVEHVPSENLKMLHPLFLHSPAQWTTEATEETEYEREASAEEDIEEYL